MVKNILVEGIDCSGKSTLVKELKNKLNWDSRSLHHKRTSQFNRYLSEYCTADKVIFERGHLSEAIYSKIFSRSRPFDMEEEKTLDWYVRKNQILILAIPNIDTALARFRKREGVFQTVNEKKLILGNKMFSDLKDKFPNSIIYTSKDFKELGLAVKRIIKITKE